MWELTDKWGPPRASGSNPFGVQRVGAPDELGLAKTRGKFQEKLAADLAALVGVRVPTVELDTIKDKGNEVHAISRVHSVESTDLVKVKKDAPDFLRSPTVQSAVKQAAGLVPFYAWIGAGDQKDDHLVLDHHADGAYHVVGVDFESAFGFGPDGGPVGAPNVPPALSENNNTNIDKAVVGKVVAAIESLSDQQIRDTVNALPLPEPDRQRIANGLIERRAKVRQGMKDRGWLEEKQRQDVSGGQA